MKTNQIEINPHVIMGKPVTRGTRIKVHLAAAYKGVSEDDLLDAYPRLARDDIRAAICIHV